MIKLFEEYNQYYTEIDELEYSRIPLNKHEKFTKEEDDAICETIPVYTYATQYDRSVKIEVWSDPKGFAKRYFYIHKIQDEWYYVNYIYGGRYNHTLYYKCDQFSGLINLLKDLERDFIE